MAQVRDDFSLLEAWRGGDEPAGRELFERYFDAVYRFFRNKVDDAAEDLVQQTFMGLVQGRDRFRGDASFRTYVFMIARKRLYSYLRDRDRAREPVEDGTTSVADLGLVSPSRAVLVRQEQHLLLQALRRLPIEMQVALELFYWEELGVAEIADVLETPIGTVKSRLQRARVRLDEIIVQLSESDALLKSTMDNFDRWARELQQHLRPQTPPKA
ncbi:MAG: RNA polymerase sigma factor [Deltaproteobacteria bacterium]|nr:RNA polymerase sigma factor [Deltaproteobacteria bacterium]MBK8238198.1 RNA polymerase sigma factor [Deltaproteobacteria bacterium]MBK8718453.1 RNA polymerase sigma factor [Deltaproteobacteria bacterium]MBP7290317.1 RNA polymerase sigma factor [Nannocystaceae bacterium]